MEITYKKDYDHVDGYRGRYEIVWAIIENEKTRREHRYTLMEEMWKEVQKILNGDAIELYSRTDVSGINETIFVFRRKNWEEEWEYSGSEVGILEQTYKSMRKEF